MKYVKTFEGFFDFLKRDKNSIEIQIESILNRLKKVQKLKENPYIILKYVSKETVPIDWIKYPNGVSKRYEWEYYEVIFDDVTVVAVEEVVPSIGLHGGVWRNYSMFFRESDSEHVGVEPLIIKESLSKKFFKILADIYHNNEKYKQLNKIKSIVNPAADLL